MACTKLAPCAHILKKIGLAHVNAYKHTAIADYCLVIFFLLANPKKDKSSGGGGDAEDWWKFLSQPPNRKWLLYGGVAVAITLLTSYNSSSGKEITWQEFRVKYLEQGEVSASIEFICANCLYLYMKVERLELVNRSYVKAYLKRDSNPMVCFSLKLC